MVAFRVRDENGLTKVDLCRTLPEASQCLGVFTIMMPDRMRLLKCLSSAGYNSPLTRQLTHIYTDMHKIGISNIASANYSRGERTSSTLGSRQAECVCAFLEKKEKKKRNSVCVSVFACMRYHSSAPCSSWQMALPTSGPGVCVCLYVCVCVCVFQVCWCMWP